MSRCVVLTLLAGLLLSSGGAAQLGKAKKVDPAALRAKLVQGQYIEGKLTKVEPGDTEHRLTLKFIHQAKTPNGAEYKKFVAAATRYNLALDKRSTSLEDIKKMQQEVRLARAAAFIIEETPVIFELAAPVKTTIFRTLADPSEGQAKVKGDPRLPGYVARFEDLALDQQVRVYLNKQKLKFGVKTKESTVYPVAMIVIVPVIDPLDDLKPVPLK